MIFPMGSRVATSQVMGNVYKDSLNFPNTKGEEVRFFFSDLKNLLACPWYLVNGL